MTMFAEGRTADPVLAANIGRLGPSFLLAQHPDDLLFREPARLHVHPLTGNGLYPFLEEVWGLRSAFIGQKIYRLADGSTVPSATF
jgi:hypothetical protein